MIAIILSSAAPWVESIGGQLEEKKGSLVKGKVKLVQYTLFQNNDFCLITVDFFSYHTVVQTFVGYSLFRATAQVTFSDFWMM